MSTLPVSGLATLPATEASQVLQAHPELAAAAGAVTPLVLAMAVRDDREAAVLADLLTVLRGHLSEASAVRDAVLHALLPDRDFPVPQALLEQVNRNARARSALAQEFGLLTSTEVAELAASSSRNAAAPANRWKTEGKIFAVPSGNQQRFPGYQFGTDGRPRAVVAQVLQELEGRLTGWELALWFTGGNGWLGGMRPVDVLDSDPELVAGAAGHLAAELPV